MICNLIRTQKIVHKIKKIKNNITQFGAFLNTKLPPIGIWFVVGAYVGCCMDCTTNNKEIATSAYHT